MLSITSFDLSILGVIGIIIIAFIVIGLIRGFDPTAFGLIALSAVILAGLRGFKNGASIANTLSDTRFLAGAVEQMAKETGKSMPLDARDERRYGTLPHGDGELLKAVHVVKQ
ncbi:MAG: hypothetical protein CMP31_07140 [Roseibacillus sp.]|jgi:hypothetical protein|nr:hypothetical protein [Roseibacillus sp.]MDP7656992.1 hypothetical protein [Roseibacillus sp.]